MTAGRRKQAARRQILSGNAGALNAGMVENKETADTRSCNLGAGFPEFTAESGAPA